jgi:hypothetical protein
MKSITEQLTTRIISELINERNQDSGDDYYDDGDPSNDPIATPAIPMPSQFYPSGELINPTHWHYYHRLPGAPENPLIPADEQQHGPADPSGPHGKYDRTLYPSLWDRLGEPFENPIGTPQDWEGFEYKPDELFPQKKPPTKDK